MVKQNVRISLPAGLIVAALLLGTFADSWAADPIPTPVQIPNLTVSQVSYVVNGGCYQATFRLSRAPLAGEKFTYTISEAFYKPTITTSTQETTACFVLETTSAAPIWGAGKYQPLELRDVFDAKRSIETAGMGRIDLKLVDFGFNKTEVAVHSVWPPGLQDSYPNVNTISVTGISSLAPKPYFSAPITLPYRQGFLRLVASANTQAPAHTITLGYFDKAGQKRNMIVWLPPWNTTIARLPISFYVGSDGSTYYADSCLGVPSCTNPTPIPPRIAFGTLDSRTGKPSSLAAEAQL